MSECVSRAKLAKAKVSAQSSLPTNVALGDAFAVLSYEYSKDRSTFGSGVLGLNCFYGRYRCFLKHWKEQSEPPQGRKKLYFGSVDIRHCYDSIDQQHLLEIVDSNNNNEKI
jgi:hypothetical protein